MGTTNLRRVQPPAAELPLLDRRKRASVNQRFELVIANCENEESPGRAPEIDGGGGEVGRCESGNEGKKRNSHIRIV